MKRFIAMLGMSITPQLSRGTAGAVLLASSAFFASAYAQPVTTGPLGIAGSAVVRGPLTVDGSLTVAGDIDSRGPITADWIERISPYDPAVRRHWGERIFDGPLTVHGSLVVHGDLEVDGPITVGGPAGAVGRVHAEGPITERR
jgi:cytoskeletal protein CcmA (bactofilin family)